MSLGRRCGYDSSAHLVRDAPEALCLPVRRWRILAFAPCGLCLSSGKTLVATVRHDQRNGRSHSLNMQDFDVVLWNFTG